jgi:hypothetical protein
MLSMDTFSFQPGFLAKGCMRAGKEQGFGDRPAVVNNQLIR